MINTDKNFYEKRSKKTIIKVEPSNKRNLLHFEACQNSNVAYVSKNKKKIIPRKQKYKSQNFY